MNQSALMLLIGGLLWLGFLWLLNGLAWLGINFYALELVLIPLSVMLYFVLVCRYVYHLPLSWARWWKFASLSALCWVAFHFAAEVSMRIGLPVLLATIIGAGANAATNVLIQRRVTFRSS